MQKANYSIIIDAPREKVWEQLWGATSYRDWTSAFAPGSDAITDWQQGSKAVFTDGSGSGMVARIKERRDNEYMSIEHLGEVKDGVEDTTSDKVRAWAGALENYTLNDKDGKTEVLIDMDTTEDFKDYMDKTWPKALNRLKEISEK